MAIEILKWQIKYLLPLILNPVNGIYLYYNDKTKIRFGGPLKRGSIFLRAVVFTII